MRSYIVKFVVLENGEDYEIFFDMDSNIELLDIVYEWVLLLLLEERFVY